MQIIPVIDLFDGVVVHAKKGARQHYLPIHSQLTASHQPLDIVAALLDVYPFEQLYIADLNAIQKLNSNYSSNYSVIAEIKQAKPALKVCVDAGICNTTELNIWQMSGVHLVIGSENFSRLENYLDIKNLLQDHFMLSLDFMPQGYVGPIELLENPQYWPQEVIVMSLANVGATQGANLNLLNTIKSLAPHHHLFAAGGVRDLYDLKQLNSVGASGVLVATAIHQQKITDKDIMEIMLNNN